MRALLSTTVAWMAPVGVRPAGGFLRQDARERELRVVDPGWRLSDGPRSQLFDVQAKHAEPPDVEVLGDPAAVERETRADDKAPPETTQERDEEARKDALDAHARQDEESAEERETNLLDESERAAKAFTILTLYKLAPALAEAMSAGAARDPRDRDGRVSGDDVADGRPALAQKVVTPGGPRSPGAALKPLPGPGGPDANQQTFDEPPRPAVPAQDKVEAVPGGTQKDSGDKQGVGPPPAGKKPPPDAKKEEAAVEPVALKPVPTEDSPSGAAAAKGWSGRVAASTAKIPPGKVPDSDIYVTQITKAAGDPNAARAAKAKTLFDETKKRLEPGDPPKDLPLIPDEPGIKAEEQFIDVINQKISLKAEDKTLPDLEPSPTGRVPILGTWVDRDKKKRQIDKATGLTKDYEEIKQINAKGEISIIKPPEPTPEKEKAKKDLDQKLSTGPKKDPPPKPAKGVTVEEKNQPNPPNVPDFAKVDITAVLARLLAQPQKHASTAVSRAMASYYGLGEEKLTAKGIGTGLADLEVAAFSNEIRAIGDAARIKADDLNAKIEERRKELLDKGKATKETLDKEAALSQQELKVGGQTLADRIEGVKNGFDTWMEDRAAAAKGLSKGDVKTLRKRKKEYKRQISERVGLWTGRYEKNGDTYKSSFAQEVLKQQNAYEAAALMDKREFEKDTKNKDGTYDATKLAEAQEKWKPIKDWQKAHEIALDKYLETVTAKIDDKVQDLTTAVENAGKAGKKLVDSWFNTMIGYEKSWWEKALDWVLSWFVKAKVDNSDLAAARAKENEEALGDDQIYLSLVINTQGENLTKAQIAELTAGDKEKTAILETYFLDGHDKVEAIAAGLAERIIGQRQGPLRQAIEKEFIAKAPLDDLLEVAAKQPPPMTKQALDEKARKVSAAFFSGFAGSAANSQVLTEMAGMTPVQARAFEIIYNQTFGKNSPAKGNDLRDLIQGKLTPWYEGPEVAIVRGALGVKTYDQEHADALLAGDQDTAMAIALEKAMQDTFLGTGLGTDSDKIFEILRSKSPSEIQAIRRAYKKRYGKDLKVELRKELDAKTGGATSKHDEEEMDALLSADTNKARAVEADRAGNGVFFGTGWGTDRKGMQTQYDRIKKEVERDADKYGMGSKWARDEYLRRTKGLEDAYEDRYGADWADKKQPGESALHAMQRDELWAWGGELKEIEGLHTDDETKIGAGRVRDQQLTFIHSSEVLLDATTGKYRRNIADSRRDGYLQVDVDMDVARRVDASKVRAPDPKTGKLTKEQIAAGYLTPKEYAMKWGDLDRPSVEARKERDRRKKEVDTKSVEDAKKTAKEDLNDIRKEFNDEWVTSPYLRDFDGVLQLKAGSWGGKSPEVKALLKDGHLTDAQQFQWAVAGIGKDKEKLKSLLRKSKPELQKMADEWAAANPPTELELKLYGPRSNYERFRARALEEFGGPGDPLMDMLFDVSAPFRVKAGIPTEIKGRDMFEVADLIDYGEAVTPQEKLARAERRAGFEGNSSNRWSSSELALAKQDVETLRTEVASLEALEAQKPDINDPKITVEDILSWNDKVNKQQTVVDATARVADASVELHRKSVDVVTDTATMIVGAVVAVVVTVVGTILSAGTATPALAAMWIGLASAVAAGVATIATKAALKGDAYGYDEMRTDMIMLVVDAIVAVATAGMGDKLFKAMKAGMALESAIAKRVAQFVAHEAENLAQILPSAFVANLLNDDNYRDGNGLWNILTGTLHQTAMGIGQGKLMGLAMKPIQNAAGRLGNAWAKSRLAKTGKAGLPEMDLLKLRGNPQERDILWKEYHAQNPSATKQQFMADLDAMLLAKSKAAFEDHQLQRAMKKELLEGLPPEVRKQFKDVKIEVMAPEDFVRRYRSDSGEAVVEIRKGKPTVVVKAGTDVAVLARESPHLLQTVRKETAALIKAIDEKAFKNWDKLPLERQLELYDKKLKLEIDAHEQMLKTLETSDVAKRRGPEWVKAELDYVHHTLDQLRARNRELKALDGNARKAIKEGKLAKPEWLEQPSRLFSKEAREALGAIVHADPNLREKQIKLLEERAKVQPLSKAEKAILDGLRKTPPQMPDTDLARHITAETRGAVETKPDFAKLDSDPAALKPVGPPDQRPVKLKEGETAQQVGDPWIEIETKSSGRKVETRTDVYRRLRIEGPDGTVTFRNEVLSRNPNSPWVERGGDIRTKGDIVEKRASLATTERQYGADWDTKVKRLENQTTDTQQGFDELLVKFDHATDPTRADLHLIEVKRGGFPGMEDISATGRNLEKNLQRLEANLNEPKWLEKHNLSPKQVELIQSALREARFTIELRVPHDMELPMSLRTPPQANRPTVLNQMETIAEAWRKLRKLDGAIKAREALPNPPPRTAIDLDNVSRLQDRLRRALLSKNDVELEAALRAIDRATGKTAEKRYDVDLTKPSTPIVQKKPEIIPKVDIDAAAKAHEAAEVAQAPKPEGGEGGSSSPPDQGPPPQAPPPVPAAAARQALADPPSLREPMAPAAQDKAQRIRTTASGTVLGWGGFDVSTSLQWKKRRFSPEELATLDAIRDRFVNIPELDPSTYSSLSPAEKRRALRAAVGEVMDVFGIPQSRRPQVIFYHGPPGDYGAAGWNFGKTPAGKLHPLTKRGVLEININCSVGDAVGTVVHEGRHYYQSWSAYQDSLGKPAHPLAKTWAKNLPGIPGGNYARPGSPRYLTQPIEQDAESFGRRLIDLLPARWP